VRRRAINRKKAKKAEKKGIVSRTLLEEVVDKIMAILEG
jgi:hypothetical protein